MVEAGGGMQGSVCTDPVVDGGEQIKSSPTQKAPLELEKKYKE